MTLKSAALFALVGMILLTVVVALGFIRDVSALVPDVMRPLEQRRTSGGGAEFHDATRGVRKPLVDCTAGARKGDVFRTARSEIRTGNSSVGPPPLQRSMPALVDTSGSGRRVKLPSLALF
jgi:hypothetical protein